MQLRDARPRCRSLRPRITVIALVMTLARPCLGWAGGGEGPGSTTETWAGPSVELGPLRTLGSNGGEQGNTFEGGTGLILRVGVSYLSSAEGGGSYEYRRVATTNRVGSSTAPVTLSAHLLNLNLGFKVFPHGAVHLAILLGGGYVGQSSYHDTQAGIVLGGSGGLRFYFPIGEHLLMLTTEASILLMTSGGSPGIGDFAIPAISALLGFVW